jgi:uncharacterized membrane protein YphA (DoxX/SURF4 family)/thiol-disulfide isomerase/thioredoxin
MNKKNTSLIIRLVIALLFLVSAVAKLSKSEIFDSPYFAITTFEVKQLYTLGFSPELAPYFSRTLIGIEIALGILLLINHYLKRITIPATIALLAVFTLHLSYVTIQSGGNSGNCGCFGELIPMTPIQAIIKNVIAISLLIWLYKILEYDKKSNFWVLTTVTFASILFLFMIAPIQPISKPIENVGLIDDNQSELNKSLVDTIKTEKIETINKDSLKKAEELAKAELLKAQGPKQKASGYADLYPNIDKGKKLLCFFAPGCDHCQNAAKELNELRKKNKDFPTVQLLFMNEEPEKIPDFFKIAGHEFPHKTLEILDFYNRIGSGKNTPGILYLHNGNVIKAYDGITENAFNAKQLEKIINKK